MDLSPLRKFEVTGPDAEALLQYALTRNVRKLAVGQVVYTAMCYEHGGMIDDGTLFRLGDNNFRWIGGDDYGGIWLREQAEKLGLKAWVRSSTDQLHNVAVQGPKSRDILRRGDLDAAGATHRWMSSAGSASPSAASAASTARRSSCRAPAIPGELGYEIFCHPKDALTVFDAIWEAGEPHGLKPLGLAGARHAADRGGARLRRLRILRPDRPVRGRHRLHRAARHRRTTISSAARR